MTPLPIIQPDCLPSIRLPGPLLALLPPLDVRSIPIRNTRPAPTLPRLYSVLGPVSAALRTLAAHHFRAVDTSILHGRIAVVRGTPCPRWHVDKVRMRGLGTLYGPGSVVRKGEEVLELGEGDVVLMEGVGVGGEGTGVWHRSPEWHGVRVIVQTDCVE